MRPVRLNGAMAGWAGSQDLSAAARAEDEILLRLRAALGAGPGNCLARGIGWLRSWIGRRSSVNVINRNVMQRVVSAHRVHLQSTGRHRLGFTDVSILAGKCEGSVKPGYRLCEETRNIAGAGYSLRLLRSWNLCRCKRFATIRAVTPVSLYGPPTVGARSRR